jgi:hypothetical protein
MPCTHLATVKEGFRHHLELVTHTDDKRSVVASTAWHKVVVPIPELYLVLHLSMPCVHFKCIVECVSKQVIEHASHDKVSGLGNYLRTKLVFLKL